MLIVGRNTVKLTPLVAIPFTVTTTEPVVAWEGTGAVILVALHDVGADVKPLKATVFAPWLLPKLVPAMVTGVPSVPEDADNDVITGMIKNDAAGLVFPSTVTSTFVLPAESPGGTVLIMLESLQETAFELSPPNLTVLTP